MVCQTPVLFVEVARHQTGSRGCARRAHVVVGETNALAMELVEVRCLDHGVAVAAELAVALVVGQDEDDVGSHG